MVPSSYNHPGIVLYFGFAFLPKLNLPGVILVYHPPWGKKKKTVGVGARTPFRQACLRDPTESRMIDRHPVDCFADYDDLHFIILVTTYIPV